MLAISRNTETVILLLRVYKRNIKISSNACHIQKNKGKKWRILNLDPSRRLSEFEYGRALLTRVSGTGPPDQRYVLENRRNFEFGRETEKSIDKNEYREKEKERETWTHGIPWRIGGPGLDFFFGMVESVRRTLKRLSADADWPDRSARPGLLPKCVSTDWSPHVYLTRRLSREHARVHLHARIRRPSFG